MLHDLFAPFDNPSLFPEKLYKFCRKEHAEALCKDGVIRIGTLGAYRGDELKGIGDSKEGIHSFSSVDPFTIKAGQIIAGSDDPFAQQFAALHGKGITAQVNGKSILRADFNGFAACFALSKDAEVAAEYDACVEISQVNLFIFELGQRFSNLISPHFKPVQFTYGKCIYVPTKDFSRIDFEKYGNIHPGLIKPKTPTYEAQKEYRLIWYPPFGTPFPPELQASSDRPHLKKITEYCKLL